jgi:hypothetical protein
MLRAMHRSPRCGWGGSPRVVGSSAVLRWGRLLVAAFATLAFAILPARLAFAGTLQVRDSASVFSAADRAQIDAAVQRCPFDVRVVTSAEYADAASFSRYVGGLVSEPNQIVVGLDPTHRHTQVHFGTGSQIDASSWPGIERAGNTAFRDGRWGPGVVAILEAAWTAVSPGSATGPSSRTAPSASFGQVTLLFLLPVAAVIFVAVVLIRRSMSCGGRRPGYGYPGYGAGYPPGRSGMGPLGGGIIGAGLGGLAGYELGKLEGERESRGGSFDSGSSSDSGGGSFDAGGGGSSWDSGSGSDFGGGGGDSGGGSDMGGGGSDF